MTLVMVRQELVVEHSVEREAAAEVAEGDAGAGAISVLVMWRRGGVLQSDDLGLLSRLMARVWVKDCCY